MKKLRIWIAYDQTLRKSSEFIAKDEKTTLILIWRVIKLLKEIIHSYCATFGYLPLINQGGENFNQS